MVCRIKLHGTLTHYLLSFACRLQVPFCVGADTAAAMKMNWRPWRTLRSRNPRTIPGTTATCGWPADPSHTNTSNISGLKYVILPYKKDTKVSATQAHMWWRMRQWRIQVSSFFITRCSVDYNSVISLYQLGFGKKLWFDGFGYHFEVSGDGVYVAISLWGKWRRCLRSDITLR